MVAISFEESGTKGLSRFLSNFPGTHARQMTKLENSLAKVAADKVRRIAPRDTGFYADVTIKVVGGVAFTNHPAARRLENGFIGVDSLGRHYTQMPRPHWSPIREEMRKLYPKATSEMTRREIKKALRGIGGN